MARLTLVLTDIWTNVHFRLRWISSSDNIEQLAFPTAWVEGGATAYLAELDLRSESNNPPNYIDVRLSPTVGTDGGEAGPQLTAAARAVLRFYFDVEGETLDLDPDQEDDTTEPYRWGISGQEATDYNAWFDAVNALTVAGANSVTLIVPGEPLAPTGLDEANIDHDSADLLWGEIDDNDGDLTAVHLDWRQGDSGAFTRITLGAAATSYALGSLSASTDYQWRVRGVNAEGNGAWSATASFTTTVTPPAPAGTIGIDTIPAYQSELVRAVIELEPYTIVESGDSLRWYSRFGSENVGSVVTTTPAGDLLIHDVSGTTQDLNLDRIWYVDRGDGTFDVRLNRDPSGNLGTQADFDAFFQGSGGGVGAILAIATEAGTVTIPMESAHWRSIGGHYVNLTPTDAQEAILGTVAVGQRVNVVIYFEDTAPAPAVALSGAASAATSASGQLTVTSPPSVALSGSASAATSASGQLTVTSPPSVALSGSASAATSASGQLTVTPPAPAGTVALSGAASAATSASGQLTVTPPPAIALEGSASAATSASGQLTVTPPPVVVLVGDTSIALSPPYQPSVSDQRVEWGFTDIADNLIDSALVLDGQDSRLDYLDIRSDGSPCAMRTAIPGDASGAAGPDFTDDFENRGQITVTIGPNTLVLTGISDATEPYSWLPSNQAEIAAFNVAVNALPQASRVGTVRFSLPSLTPAVVSLSGSASADTSASGQLTVTPPPSVALSGSASADTSASGQLTVTPPAPAGTIGIDTIPAYQSELVRAVIELEPYTIVESGDSLRWYSRFGSENVGSVVTTTPAGDLLIHDVSGTTQDLNLDRIWYVDRGDGTFDVRLNRDPSGNLGTQADFDAFFQGSGGGVGAILAIATEAGTVTIPMESAHWRSIGGHYVNLTPTDAQEAILGTVAVGQRVNVVIYFEDTAPAPAVALSGAASADTSASGQLTVTSPPSVALSGSASAATSASGQLTVTPPAPAGTVALSGSASADTSASGQLTVTNPPAVALEGSASADTSASGQLTVNSPPEVTIQTVAQTVPAGAVLSLAATASDTDGSIALLRWTGGGTFANAGAEDTDWTAPLRSTQQVYVLRLMATDDNGATAYATVAITVQAAPVDLLDITSLPSPQGSSALRFDPASYELRITDAPFRSWSITEDLQNGLTCFRGRREPLQHFGISGAGSLTVRVQNWDRQWDSLHAEGKGALVELVMHRDDVAEEKVRWVGILDQPLRVEEQGLTWLDLQARGLFSTLTNRRVTIPVQGPVASDDAWDYLCEKIGIVGHSLSQEGGSDVVTFPRWWEQDQPQFAAVQRLGLSTGGGWVREARDELALILEHRNTRILDRPSKPYGFPTLVIQDWKEYSTEEASQRTQIGYDDQTFSLGALDTTTGPVIWDNMGADRLGPWRGDYFEDGDPGYSTYLHLGSGQGAADDEGKMVMHFDNEQVAEKNLTSAMVAGGSFILTSGDDVLTIPGTVLEADPIEPYTFIVDPGDIRTAMVDWCVALRAKSQQEQAGVTLTLRRPIKLAVAVAAAQGLETDIVELQGDPEAILWARDEADAGYPLSLAAGAQHTIAVAYPTPDRPSTVVGVTMLEAIRHPPRTFTGYETTVAGTGNVAAGTLRWIEDSRAAVIGLLAADQTDLAKRLALGNRIVLTDGTVTLAGRLASVTVQSDTQIRVVWSDEVQLTGTAGTLADYIASNGTGWSLANDDPADYTLAGSGEIAVTTTITETGWDVEVENTQSAAVELERIQVRGHDARGQRTGTVTSPAGADNPEKTPRVFMREDDIGLWHSFLALLKQGRLIQIELMWHGDDDPAVLLDLDLSARIPVVYGATSGNFFVEGIQYTIEDDWIDVRLWLTLDVGYAQAQMNVLAGGDAEGQLHYWDAVAGRTEQTPDWPIFGGSLV